MATTFNINNNVGKVRNIIGDTDTSDAHFTDERIDAFLDLKDDDILLASALALRSMAASKAFVAKLRRAGNYTEDSRDIAKGLLDAAKIIETDAKNIPAEAQADVAYTDFNYNEILIKKSLRGELPDG